MARPAKIWKQINRECVELTMHAKIHQIDSHVTHNLCLVLVELEKMNPIRMANNQRIIMKWCGGEPQDY